MAGGPSAPRVRRSACLPLRLLPSLLGQQLRLLLALLPLQQLAPLLVRTPQRLAAALLPPLQQQRLLLLLLRLRLRLRPQQCPCLWQPVSAQPLETWRA